MMKRFLLILLVGLLSFEKAGNETVLPAERSKDIYSALHLVRLGLTQEAFRLAIKGFEKLLAEGKLPNDSILTIIDFSQSSKNKRLYVLDVRNKALLFNTYVAHGHNTGEEFANKFSNKSGSLMSSLGFYITRNIRQSTNVGLSLVLEGLEKGFNDQAAARDIIMHGAWYSTETFIRYQGRLGRSHGCPAVPPDMIKPLSETIKEGSCLFIFSPDKDYLSRSKLLN